jgi:hypothetical protein
MKDEDTFRAFPEAFRSELAEIFARARNGGVVSRRRHGGLLTEFKRVKTRYDAKIANLRAFDPSPALAEVEAAITKIEQEFVAALSIGRAAA